MLDIAVAREHPTADVDAKRLRLAVNSILSDAGIASGEVSIAIVDDARMHELNRRYLDHDYPTDVLSFVLAREGDRLEGQIVVSADYAAREASRYGWSADDELLLYTIHGALHLVGYDDSSPDAKLAMRQQERAYLAQFGLKPRYDDGQ
ncbi:MAG TPA: rRNA maturation RNase YbeY [Pirellulaceae bacterium]|nr:rRNA maturation RNase YbeY [Pirellulaceae bacterium]